MSDRFCKITNFFSMSVIIISLIAGFIAFVMERIDPVSKKHTPNGLYEKYMKRPLDVFLSTGAIIVLMPILLVTAVLVRVKLGTPVLFKQVRPGKDEKLFSIYKFRTMADKRDEEGNLLPDDERLTNFGRTLRKTSLDELPELFNIIKGDMAVVGPRPLLTDYLPFYTEDEHHRHDVRPGLTGLAQIHGRNATSWQTRFAWDLNYVRSITFLTDFKIIITTFFKVLKKSDVLMGKEISAGRLDVARSEEMKVAEDV